MTDETASPAANDSVAPATPATPEGKAGTKGSGKTHKGAVWMGTAVGVGSAALVAALMYAKRRK